MTKKPKERFDINRCTVGGVIQKIWDRQGDIFVRLGFRTPESEKLRYLTLRIPEGQVDGQFVSLQPGAHIRVSGYLADEPYTESLAEFLRDARKNDLLDSLSQADKLRAVRVKRTGTRLDVLELEHLETAITPEEATTMLQGVVAKVWEIGADLKARLAIYDRYTTIDPRRSSQGRTHRVAHYVTVRFPNGEAAGQEIHLATKNRLRASGSLQVSFYKETLREVLLKAGAANLIGQLDGHDPDEIYAIRDSIMMDVQSAIVLASMRRKQTAEVAA